MADENTYGFNREDADAIGALIGGDERGQYEQPALRQRTGVVFLTPVGGIAARSGTTAGSASCTPYYLSGSTLTVWNNMDTTAKTVTVYNIFATAIGASAYITAKWTRGGFVADAEDCS